MATGSDNPDDPTPKGYIPLVKIESPPLSEKLRQDAGYYLNLIQDGALLSMPISRPMPSIGPRVHELRLSDGPREWRVVYRIDAEDVLVVDVFKKTTPQTPRRVIDRCRRRLAAYDAIEPRG